MINFLNRLKHPGAFLAEPFPQETYNLFFEEFESRLSERLEKDRVVGTLDLVETSFEQRCVLRPNVVYAKGYLLVTYEQVDLFGSQLGLHLFRQLQKVHERMALANHEPFIGYSIL